jgi:hypothetical protein
MKKDIERNRRKNERKNMEAYLVCQYIAVCSYLIL